MNSGYVVIRKRAAVGDDPIFRTKASGVIPENRDSSVKSSPAARIKSKSPSVMIEVATKPLLKSLCMVTSLHDGMNLVAKEFVASRNNHTGVLILSRFTGAAQELAGAIIVNPYDIEEMADSIKTAIEMQEEEQRLRMDQMRQIILQNNIYFWAASLIKNMDVT